MKGGEENVQMRKVEEGLRGEGLGVWKRVRVSVMMRRGGWNVLWGVSREKRVDMRYVGGGDGHMMRRRERERLKGRGKEGGSSTVRRKV